MVHLWCMSYLSGLWPKNVGLLCKVHNFNLRPYGEGIDCETASRDKGGLATDRSRGFPLVVKLTKTVFELIINCTAIRLVMYSCSGLNSAQLKYLQQRIHSGFPGLCFTELYVNPSKGYFLITIQFRTIWIPTKPYYEKRTFFVCPTFRGLPKFHPKTTITVGLVMIFQVFKKNVNSLSLED